MYANDRKGISASVVDNVKDNMPLNQEKLSS